MSHDSLTATNQNMHAILTNHVINLNFCLTYTSFPALGAGCTLLLPTLIG